MSDHAASTESASSENASATHRPVEPSNGVDGAPPGAVGEPSGAPSSETRSSQTTEPSPTIQHAEALLDEAGQRVGQWAAQASLWLRKVGALAREGAEDMLDEAQRIRRRERR